MKSRITLGCVVLIGAACCTSPLAATQLFVGSYKTSGQGGSEIFDYDLATAGLDNTFDGGGLDRPRGGAIGPDGNLYVTSIVTNQILRYNPATGAFIDIFASAGLSGPNGMTLGPDGNFYVANSTGGGEVRKINGTTGADLGVFATGQHAGHEFFGVVFGPDGALYASTPGGSGARGVFRYNGTTGVHEANIFGSESEPTALLVGTDYLYVGDNRGGDNPRVHRYKWSDGSKDILVDDVEGIAAGLLVVAGLNFDANGDLLASSFGATNDFIGDKVVRMNISTGAYINDFASVDNPTFLVQLIPEPSTLLLVGSALGSSLAFGRRRKRAG